MLLCNELLTFIMHFCIQFLYICDKLIVEGAAGCVFAAWLAYAPK